MTDISKLENINYSLESNRVLHLTKDYLLPNILSRYAMFDRPTSGLSNPIVDNFFPRAMYQTGLRNHLIKAYADTLPRTSVAISPFIANILGVKAMETEQLCRILGYTKKDIHALLKQVKAKSLYISFVGFGGTGVNTAVWLKRMCEMTTTVNLFRKVEVNDADSFDFSNLFRLPIDFRSVVVGNYNPEKRRLANVLLRNLSENLIVSNCENIAWHSQIYKELIYYGAPTLETRKLFSDKENSKFISATHSGNEAYIHLNPTVDTNITIESYGLISLTQFFMNQLRMAIGFLELLASDQDLTQKDVDVLNYGFDGTSKLPTDRTYNFQLEHSGLMMTPEEAANA